MKKGVRLCRSLQVSYLLQRPEERTDKFVM